MAELLDRIHAEIRERLDARRPAAEEYERLQAALDALGGPLALALPLLPVAHEPDPEPAAELAEPPAEAPPLAA